MKTHKFARKPFYVDAVRVSEENIEEVAKWCEGEILADTEGRHIKVRVHRPLTDKQTKAYIGDWVLFSGQGFKVYTPKAFDKSFEKVRKLSKEQADQAGIVAPHEPSRKPKPHTPRKLTQPMLAPEQKENLKKAFQKAGEVLAEAQSRVQVNMEKAAPKPVDPAEALIQEVLREKR